MARGIEEEADLYRPVKRFLESQGYEVKAEIDNCDVIAIRGDEEPVVVELKRALNLDVILQAVDRLALTPKVYVGVPCRTRMMKSRRRPIVKLLRMLGLGLLEVDPRPDNGRVDVVLDPVEYRPRISKRRQERLLGEFVKRAGDPNRGGSSMRRGIMTAYRQSAIAIGVLLVKNGATKASDVARTLGEPKARAILYRNVYGWFERESRGVYRLSARGEKELPLWR